MQFPGLGAIIHEVVEAFSAALDAKHSYTKGHSDRVADIAAAIAAGVGFSRREQERIHTAGHLHDIGKIGIPDNVLLKPGRLNNEEYDIIKLHPQIGYDILQKVTIFRPIAGIVLHHHERWDGCGYPGGLQGEDIPLGARIIAIADAYDAMTSARSYRQRISSEQAIAEIKRCAGTQFDPALVKIFLTIQDHRRRLIG